MRLAILTLAFTAATFAAPAIEVLDLAGPPGATSLAPSLSAAPDGTVWLTWVDKADTGETATAHGHHAAGGNSEKPNTLRVATFAPATRTWSTARTIAQDATVSSSSADFPLLAVDGRGTAFALWTDGRGGANVSQSKDRGLTWSGPRPWTKASKEVEKFALTRLENGRILVAWLDGRAHADAPRPQQLFARLIDAADTDEQLVDASVCDCCQTALAALMDGGAVVAYRGRTAEEVRDTMTARWRAGSWEEPRRLSADEWVIKGCPVNGPRLAVDRSRAAVAWFTGADNEAKVLVSFSPDAGARWLMPLRIDQGKPVGHVETIILSDGAILVTWLESDGSLWCRRITPEFATTEAVQLAPPGTASTRGFPRAVLLADYAGERTSAEVMLAYPGAGNRAGIRLVKLTIPEGDLLAAERNCACTPSAQQLRSLPLRARVRDVEPTANLVLLQHGEVPGVFAAGQHKFKVPPTTLGQLRTGAEIMARIYRDGSTWILDDVQLLGAEVR